MGGASREYPLGIGPPSLPRMRYAFRILLVFFSLATPAGAAEDSANAVFLVASPVLLDPNFHQTVVLVTQPREG